MNDTYTMRLVDTDDLTIACLEAGAIDGWPVVLTHGFPYDVHAYDEVTPILVRHGARVLVPYVRGFGPTRFRREETMRSGQQAALGGDLIGLLDGLGIDRAIAAGFDWGGMASCAAAALWPDRIAGLVSMAGYDIVDVERQRRTFDPSVEMAVWYQHLFQTQRGRECLAEYRRDLCRMLWEQWSPGWSIDELRFRHAAAAWENPDFVDVVVHSYRFGFGLAPGDPVLGELETRLACKPSICVPTVTMDGAQDPLKPGGSFAGTSRFTSRHEHRVVTSGHALPYEAPGTFADAVLTVKRWCSS